MPVDVELLANKNCLRAVSNIIHDSIAYIVVHVHRVAPAKAQDATIIRWIRLGNRAIQIDSLRAEIRPLYGEVEVVLFCICDSKDSVIAENEIPLFQSLWD